MWIVRCTLVSAKFACNTLCGAHMTKWNATHVAAAQHMLKYLKFMKSEGLTFRKKTNPCLSMKLFCDANFGADTLTMRSTSAFAIVVETVGTILFLSKQQTTVSKSTMEAEYRCASHAGKVFEGFVNLFGQLGLQVATPVPMYIDNTATIAAIKMQATSFKLRHLLLDHAHLRELSHRGLVSPEHIDGLHNPADDGTKSLPAELTARYTAYILDSADDHVL